MAIAPPFFSNDQKTSSFLSLSGSVPLGWGGEVGSTPYIQDASPERGAFFVLATY